MALGRAMTQVGGGIGRWGLSDGPITVGEERRTAYGASGERPWRASDLASGDGEWVGGGEVVRRGETNTAHARA
uniref:Uncharacterized protein n=1 Tax=Oryza sativa subsp. japonica TaxID=39947 RepID=Q2R8J9_ORYSJ|nr:hypothetical protein LOC_Os11g11930 [Oryza sativa Japonica Group]